jgi:hypothetical protein
MGFLHSTPIFHDAMTQEFRFCTSLCFFFLLPFFSKKRILRHCVMELQKARVLRGFLHDASRFALRHVASFASWLRHRAGPVSRKKSWGSKKKTRATLYKFKPKISKGANP